MYDRPAADKCNRLGIRFKPSRVGYELLAPSARNALRIINSGCNLGDRAPVLEGSHGRPTDTETAIVQRSDRGFVLRIRQRRVDNELATVQFVELVSKCPHCSVPFNDYANQLV